MTPTIEDLYPDLSPEEQAEAEARFEAYLRVILRIVEGEAREAADAIDSRQSEAYDEKRRSLSSP